MNIIIAPKISRKQIKKPQTSTLVAQKFKISTKHSVCFQAYTLGFVSLNYVTSLF